MQKPIFFCTFAKNLAWCEVSAQSKIIKAMSTVALQDLWSDIQAYNLSAANMRWLAEQLLAAATAEDTLCSYTREELEARIAESEADYVAGRVYTTDEVLRRMQQKIEAAQCK